MRQKQTDENTLEALRQAAQGGDAAAYARLLKEIMPRLDAITNSLYQQNCVTRVIRVSRVGSSLTHSNEGIVGCGPLASMQFQPAEDHGLEQQALRRLRASSRRTGSRPTSHLRAASSHPVYHLKVQRVSGVALNCLPKRRQRRLSNEIAPAPRQSRTSNIAAHWIWVGHACG